MAYGTPIRVRMVTQFQICDAASLYGGVGLFAANYQQSRYKVDFQLSYLAKHTHRYKQHRRIQPE